jgi:nicotinate-nucleotide adenylyltransferase
MRIGLFGGTFNPIHSGHLKAAKEVGKRFVLNKTAFIPSFLPPHKKPDRVADADDRMEMIRLAVSDDADFSISDVEQQRLGPSYTIDTVCHYRSVLPPGTSIFLVVGLDAFLELDTWKSYPDLFKMIPFIVMARHTNRCDDLSFMLETLEPYIKKKISDRYRFSDSQCGYVHPENQPVFLFNFRPLDISSTKIRRLIAGGKSIHHLVPEKVEDYIQTKGLYR